MPCSRRPDRWVARAQPWLGTLVEVALAPAEADEARFAAAFDAIAHVHARMNAHDPASDLARIARAAHRHPVRVDRQTAAVLKLAQRLHGATQGRFDVTLPARRRGRAHAGMQALQLARGQRVRAATPLRLDLSGIAKGHAVDRAIDALRRSGASAGLVNAGGDLRIFGPTDWLPVRVRLPQSPTVAPPILEIRDAAVATSSDAFRGTRAALHDPRGGRLRRYPGSITVVAPSCATADALTKVVALAPARAPRILARWGAHALRLGPEAKALSTTCAGPTAHLRLPAAAVAEE